MATIPQLQIPQLGAVSGGADFAPLAQLGNIYQKAQQDAANKAAFAEYQQTGDPKALLKSGDMNLARLGESLAQERRAEAFRQAEAQRAQQNTDRSFGFQQTEAQRAQQNADRGYGLQVRSADRLEDRTPTGYEPNPDKTPGAPKYIPQTGVVATDPVAAARAATIKSDAEREARKQAAIANGLTPGTPAFLRYVLTGSSAGAAGSTTNPPANHFWVDPEDLSKGAKPIPGGPAEKVDAEVAGRLGLAKSFLVQLPKIKEDIEKGVATGLWDATGAMSGRGRAGEIKRQISSGADALTRLLTGAGMNMAEATEYADRYRLGFTDSADMVKSKLNQLEVELNTIGAEVGKGRGGWSVPTAPPAATGAKPDPMGLR